ncbi:formylglycine-generating enzyme family protein [Promineifilum sp.]|uniref:formylglycine-generating enzyme family protein n=1 Tax=Promineifilum sp. TaxID=2664178 RepID=UPI0035AEC087
MMDDPQPMYEDDATQDFYQFMVDNLDADELEAMAFEIGVDPGELDGALAPELAESLLRYLAQRDDLQLLDLALRDLFPVQYGETFGERLREDAQLDTRPPRIDGYHHDVADTDLVRVPGGPFPYGETPVEHLDLPTFHIGRTPVTNAAYKRFLDANPDHRVPFLDDGDAWPYNWDPVARLYPAGRDDHPVVLVSWDDARAFCGWAGLRLPTEQEWEKAARGVDARRYPWGDDDADPALANYGGNAGETTPVEVYSPDSDSPYGAADMAGNVWEWTASPYDEDGPASVSGARTLRGGAWDSEELELESNFRRGREPELRAPNVGFRVAGE